MENKYKKEDQNTWLLSDFWTKNNFKKTKVSFIKLNQFPKSNYWNDSLRNIKNNKVVYAFSEPILYKKKYAVFAFSKCGTSDYGFSIEPSKIVMMEYKNNKWVFNSLVEDGILN